MAVAKRLRRALLAALAIAGILLWFVALLLLSEAVENSDDLGRVLPWLVIINTAGITVLVVLIVVNVTQLIKDHRRHVPGVRLRVRLVTLLVMVAVTPLLGVYLFSIEFVNRGIDDWLDLDLHDSLELTLEYGKDLLEERKRERREQTVGFAARLAQLQIEETEPQLYSRTLSAMRAESNASELTLFGTGNRILATSAGFGAPAMPRQLSREMQLSQELDIVTAESSPDGHWEILAVVRLPRTDVGGTQYLQAVYPLEAGMSRVVNQIQEMHVQFGSLQLINDPLKLAFTLILSIVLLVSLLASVYGAFYFSRRLLVPIQQLMQGTRAVARGDFGTRVPISARDEIGFLVNSFNDMTLRLAQASEAARSSNEQVERERSKLEVILARLSTGVVSLEADLRIRTANHAAGTILGLDLEACVGQSLVALAADNPLLAQFLTVTASHFERGDREWREQLMLRGEGGRRVLMCACTELPGDADRPTGHVIVFDDITALLQAQRDAAWGEVARRLAHEIKNPLTPIQLSAERLRRKYLKPEAAESDLLDRATHTIIQQVEAMKQMVNAFSEYARTPRMDMTSFDVNALIREVAELYASHERPIAVNLALSPSLPPIEADAGRMRQVLHNLLRNAIEALEHQDAPRIDITTRRAQTGAHEVIEITVADNGPGFLAEFLHQAFDPYVTSKPKGTGLGLAIVKKLVEEHGGQISARNRAQGGAEISILMPISAETSIEALHRRSDQRRERA